MTGNVQRKGELHIIALTKSGLGTGRQIQGALGGTLHIPEKYIEGSNARPFDMPVARLIGQLWDSAAAFVLVMASGIAVRSIAPLLDDKYTDPAVLVIDPLGKFAVPILSGHLGGANKLAMKLKSKLKMTPVITTATDVLKVPAIEVWAKDHGLRWNDREGILKVNSAWANKEGVSIYLDPHFDAALLKDLLPHVELFTRDEGSARLATGPLIAITHRKINFPGALFLVPPILSLGVGTRRNAEEYSVEKGILSKIDQAGFSRLAIASVASVEAKKYEEAINHLARNLGVNFTTFTSEELSLFETPNPSVRVKEAVGTPSVCEAAALAASGGGKLIMEKVSDKTWTLAIALKNPEQFK